MKFHGSYQQYDRDSATARKREGEAKAYRFMVRVRVPGGRLTPEQYLTLDELAGSLGDGTLRITTRQTFQFHGVAKGGLKATIARINDSLLTTLATCGDVVRNVVTTPAPIADAIHARLEADARAISQAFLPWTRAYHEIWLDGEKLDLPEDEPLYGATYLPRKFKIAIATPDDNTADVLTNDLGIVALFEGERLTGYNLCLGGGQGMTHNRPATYPRLATPIAFVGPDDLLAGVEAVVRLQRDHGDRADRRHARLKYLVEEKGVAWTRKALEEAFGGPLDDPREVQGYDVPDHLGWHEQGDGLSWLGLPVASGRIGDRDDIRLRSAIRRIVADFGARPILTPGQDILLADLPPRDRIVVEAILRDHGVSLAEDLTPLARLALACPALPTCGLALTEAERIREPVVTGIEAVLARQGLSDVPIGLRITGCPNGCARPYACDIGLVGRMPGHYALFVGGDLAGTRLNTKLLEKVALADVPAVLEPLLALFARERRDGEGFGDFCHRVGIEHLRTVLDDPSRLAAAE